MSSTIDFKLGRVHKPPEGKAFVWHTLDLMVSPAWRSRSVHCARLLEFLEIENMRHAGKENGQLIATYDQLEKFGIGRRFITAAVDEAETLGLVEVIRRGRVARNKSYENQYRLTYLAARVIPDDRAPYYVAPTNEWDRVTEEKARAIAERAAAGRRDRNATKSVSCGAKGELKQVQKVHLTSSPSGTSATELLENAGAVSLARGAKGEPLSISRTLQSAEQQPANENVASDEQADLERYLAQLPPTPPDELRQDLKAHLAEAPRGEQARIAAAAGMTTARLSQFKAGGTLSPKSAEALMRALLEAKAA